MSEDSLIEYPCDFPIKIMGKRVVLLMPERYRDRHEQGFAKALEVGRAFQLVDDLLDYTATSEQDVHFNQLHKKCGGRLKQKLYCPVDDEYVERADLVKEQGVLGWLVVSLGDTEDADLGGFAKIELGGTRDIANVFNEQ